MDESSLCNIILSYLPFLTYLETCTFDLYFLNSLVSACPPPVHTPSVQMEEGSTALDLARAQVEALLALSTHLKPSLLIIKKFDDLLNKSS